MTIIERRDRCNYLYARMQAAESVGNYEQADAYMERLNRHWRILLRQIDQEEAYRNAG